jgi:serine/threonine protein kinase
VIGQYNLLERLEPAGPGDLFRARDTRKGRTVAVRVLPPDFITLDERTRFIDRARAMSALSHPNITTIFDVGLHEGSVFLVFEFLTGRSLRSEMGSRPLNVRRAIDMAIQMADAVAHAHAAGYVHGGLSPESVVITAKGHAKIPTFALASRGGFASDGTSLHDYDAPEETLGQGSDERSDIYSVGAVLFEMLTTRRPHLRGAAAPSASNPKVLPELDAVVLKAIAPNPDSRFQSAAVFASELRALAAVVEARGVVDDTEGGPPPPPKRGIGVAVAIGLLIVALASLWWLGRQ